MAVPFFSILQGGAVPGRSNASRSSRGQEEGARGRRGREETVLPQGQREEEALSGAKVRVFHAGNLSLWTHVIPSCSLRLLVFCEMGDDACLGREHCIQPEPALLATFVGRQDSVDTFPGDGTKELRWTPACSPSTTSHGTATKYNLTQQTNDALHRYEGLKEEGKLSKFMEKKRKKNAAKDHRWLPSKRQDRG